MKRLLLGLFMTVGCDAGTASGGRTDDPPACANGGQPPDCRKPCSEDGECDNALFCDGAETCGADGACETGTAPALADGDPCTIDACNEADDTLTHTPQVDGGTCDDGVFCNGADSCLGGACTTHAGDPCASGGECADTCDELGATCDVPVGTACTDDANGCTDDVCDGAGECSHPPNTAACDDGVFCNGADTCAGGACAGHAGDPCAAGAECADTCDETIESCNTPAAVACGDDGDTCTADVCDGSGTCEHPDNGTCVTVSSIFPPRGTVGGPLTLAGRGFGAAQGGQTVTFDGVAATVVSWSDAHIVVIVPAGLEAGAASVVVTPSGASATYHVLPWIRTLEPRHAGNAEVVTVIGASFGTAPGGGTIGGQAATVVSWSDTAVELEVPASAPRAELMLQLVTSAGVATNVYPVHVTGSDGWKPMDHSPLPAWWPAAVWTGTEMMVWGGWNTNNRLGRGFRYDPVSDTWVGITELNAPAGRSDHTMVWTGSEMLVWGGWNGNNMDYGMDTGGRYDPATDTWTATSIAGAPLRRQRHTAVWTGSEMIVWGGRDGSTYRNTGGIYDPETDTWRPTSTNGAPAARWDHDAVWTGSRMLVWGGNGVGGGSYDPETDSWTAMSRTNEPAAGSGKTAVWTGIEMIVCGGRASDPAVILCGRYNPATDAWSAVSTTAAPEWRTDHNAVWTGGRMVVWGGTNGGYLVPDFNTGASYDPETDTWTPMTLVEAPRGRKYHAGVWTGLEMIVWGGTGRGNDGGRYDPAADSWRPTRPQAGPRTAVGTTIWTGTEMISWSGGPDGGARYDPNTDTWTPLSTVGEPGYRVSHTAVWTGSRMLIWGGVEPQSTTYPREGFSYDPSTDTWTALSTTIAPAGRVDHTAVWTGTEMIIWGGLTGTTVRNDGRRYNLASDTWTDMNLTNPPMARRWHGAVWTGTVMVIWGGHNGISDLATGARYNPSNDTWAATAAGGPSSRRLPLALWVQDSRMLIWGGGAGGGLYDPVNDTWTQIPSQGSVTTTTAVWTGTELIAWNGTVGARWNSGSNVWTPINSAGGPASGSGAASAGAVWTGTEMVVYDGINGGRYTP